MNKQNESVPGTIIWIAPFYNRSGYGVGARTTVASLHKAGLRIRIISVNEVEPGIDDCDLSLIQSLEKTQVILPITTIITHVPSKVWLDMKFPEPNVRIMDTTFDSSAQGNLPPAEWMAVCNEMDQVWLMTEQEREAFVSAGLPSEKFSLFVGHTLGCTTRYCRHPYLKRRIGIRLFAFYLSPCFSLDAAGILLLKPISKNSEGKKTLSFI